VKRYSRSWPRLLATLAVVLTAACGPHPAAAQGPVPANGQDPNGLPPAGFGTLRQDDIGIQLGMTSLRIRVIPLDERVIRLLAPDAYRSLHDMRESRAAEITGMARSRGDSVATFMVTFFGLQPQTRFSPDELLIASQNATWRPLGVIPITPRFSENLVNAREQAAAIYVYEPNVVVMRPFSVVYQGAQSDAWTEALNKINTERARVLGRASQSQARP
jgi:hypothetical protein